MKGKSNEASFFRVMCSLSRTYKKEQFDLLRTDVRYDEHKKGKAELLFR